MSVVAAVRPASTADSPPRAMSPLKSMHQETFLVTVVDRAAIDQLPLAAADVARAGGRLLVALARPRLGFTTDAVVVWRAGIHAAEELARLEDCAQRVLADADVGYEVVPMPYRDSRSPHRRSRRIAAAAARLARQRRATPLPHWDAQAPSGAPAHPGDVPGVGRGPAPVVAVLEDSADAVRVARAAGLLALTLSRRLVLLVPVTTSSVTPNRSVLTTAHACTPSVIDRDTAAIAARVQPTLDALGVRATVLAAPHRAEQRLSVAARGLAAAITVRTRPLHPAAVVISAASPAVAFLDLPGVTVHRVQPARFDALDGEPAALLTGHRQR